MISCALFEPFALWRAVRERPELAGKPLVTLHRGEVAAMSAEAGRRGVALGMGEQGARSRCNELLIVGADPVTLGGAWDAVLTELYAFTDRIESPRPGLVFFGLSPTGADRVARLFGVAVGTGSSQEEAHLKALAGDDVDRARVSVLRAVGLKKKSVERLEWLGVKEVGQLRRWDKSHTSRYLAKEAKVLSRYLKGPYTTTVARYTPTVTLTESYTFEDAVTEPREIFPVLEHLSHCMARGLRDRAASRLTLHAEASGLRFSSARRGKTPLRGDRLFPLARLALQDCGALGLELDGLALELSGLYRSSEQGALWQQRENIDKARAQVEARFPGAMMRLETLNPHMPVGNLAYRYRSPGGERVTREGISLGHRSQKRHADARERATSLAGDRLLPPLARLVGGAAPPRLLPGRAGRDDAAALQDA